MTSGLLSKINSKVLVGGIIIILLIIFALLYHISRNPLTTVVEVPNENTDEHTMETSKYNAVLENSQNIVIGVDTDIQVDIYDTETETKITAFDKLELVIVDTELNAPTFLEPKIRDAGYLFTTKFSEAGLYLAYLFFKPAGEQEEVRSFNFYIDNGEYANSSQPVDVNFVKQVDDIRIDFSNGGELEADKLNGGNQTLVFDTGKTEIKVPKSSQVIVINQQTYNLVRFDLADEAEGQNTLEFKVASKQEIFRGVYRIFLSFENEGENYITEFTSEVR